MLYVLESKGSSPGRQGFFMSVNANDEMCGSIGGGIMEHKFVELAKEKLKEENSESIIKKQIHNKSAAANQSGMICSGEQTLFIYKLQEKDIAAINQIIDTLEINHSCTVHLSTEGIEFSCESTDGFVFDYKNDEEWNYAERLGYRNHLYIVGGGHCALAFSNLMRTMDFYIHLFEDREHLNTVEQNQSTNEKIIVNDYSELKNLIPSGKNNYVVLMTFGYRTDALALRAVIDKEFKYLGMLGSKAKIKQLFEELMAEGISEEKIDRIHSPIGIDIKSETPEEIAVSIAAEIVAIKNKS